MWKKILWLQEPVNVDDVFIDIGGNSLTATRCVNMIKAAFNVDVPLDLFFMDDGTVAVLAKLIDERATGEVRTTR
ncbi:MAG: hypothetical protein ABS36_00055 [Acidobacteria bacterium SCN 69-37]|nr:MAG: hypothetical protein ABS36_00055 [Acidobacteria bacterium SCN 69-37]